MSKRSSRWSLPVCALLWISCADVDDPVQPGPGAGPLGERQQSLVPDSLANGIALTGPSAWTTLPTATYAPGGSPAGTGTMPSFTITNEQIGDGFGPASGTPGVIRVSGDFDGDQLSDVALVHSSWDYIHIAYGLGQGQFTVRRNPALDGWKSFLATPGARVISGDFDADGKTDLALTGGSRWRSIPVAFARGKTAPFSVHNDISMDFFSLQTYWGSDWMTNPTVEVLAGDFDCDSDTDLALVGVPGWNTIPIARSNRDGTWTVQNPSQPEIAKKSARAGVKRFVGNFDEDSCADIALVGDATFLGVPLASGRQGGAFVYVEKPIASDFAVLAASADAKVVAGRFNNDLKMDLAVLGLSSGLLPVALAFESGFFFATSFTVPELPFVQWSRDAPTVLVADFDRNGSQDLGLVGVGSWNTIPIALSQSDGHFVPKNVSAVGNGLNFANASSFAPTRVTGNFEF